MKKVRNLTLLGLSIFSIAFYLISCASNTEVTGTWSRENVNKQYNNLMVAALTSTTTVKSEVEEELAQSLREEGVNASKSINELPTRFVEGADQKQRILDRVRENGIDGILTVSLIDEETETRYVPGSAYYAPFPAYGYYGTFWGYYDYWFPRFQSPGYYNEQKVYFIETNLYDAETEELVWSAQSRTYDPKNLESFSEEFAEDIIEHLNEENII